MGGVRIRTDSAERRIELPRQPGQETARPQVQGPVQAAYRRAQADRDRSAPADFLALQSAMGNRQVKRIMAQQGRGGSRVDRATYKIGDAKVNIDYGNVVGHDAPAESQSQIEARYTAWTGLPAAGIHADVAALTNSQRKWLHYAIDVLSDNPLVALDKTVGVQRLIQYAPVAAHMPLVAPAFNFETEVLRASGWLELALTAKLQDPNKAAQSLLDKEYNPSAIASGATASSTCPVARPASAQLDEPKLRKDLESLLRAYVTKQAGIVASVVPATHNLPDIKSLADVVQAEALSFFAPYIGRSHTRAFQQTWKYSAHIKASTAPGAIPVEARRAFIANRARGLADKSGLFDTVHYDPRCDADELVFADIINKLEADALVQTGVNTILSWLTFTEHGDTSAEITLNLQHKASDDECEARWSEVETLCHELMHAYVSQDFYDMSKNRQLITEGFPEVLGDQLYTHIRSAANSDDKYRKRFEQGLSAAACSLGSIPHSKRGYPTAAESAEKIRVIVGDNNFRAAYFLGRNSLAGLQPKLQSGGQDDAFEREADAVAGNVMAAHTGTPLLHINTANRSSLVQRQSRRQSPQDKAAVAMAKERLAVLEPKLAALEGNKLAIEAEQLRVLADRKRLDENAGDPLISNKEQAEESNFANLNRAPVDVAVGATGVVFKVRFHVRFEDASMTKKFSELTTNVQAGIDQVWKQNLGGVFAGRSFTIVPSFVLVDAAANRDKNYWLITVRKVSTGAAVTYPGCTLEQPDPTLATSVTEPMCDGGVMSIPPSHTNKPDVLGHEMLHLFGLIDRYRMWTEVMPGKKPKVTLDPVRETGGRPDPLGGQIGAILREDLGYLFDKFGVYSQEEARSTAGLDILKREIARLHTIVELGYDPHSLIPPVIREDFKDKMIKDAENL